MITESPESLDVDAVAPHTTHHLPSGGYLQISLATDGRIQVRGTRTAVEEFLFDCALVAVEFETNEPHWCG